MFSWKISSDISLKPIEYFAKDILFELIPRDDGINYITKDKYMYSRLDESIPLV